MRDDNVYAPFDAWTAAFAQFVNAKGKVPPGRFRAYGYEAPGHRWADLKLYWRSFQMARGTGPEGSSPAEQEERGLNDDATISIKKTEGEKLREDRSE